MELTIGEVLQQGITAHKEGKIQEAERLYRAIIQSQPAHPDANHNLGILEVSLNKAELALPLFETALEANPKIEQFWLSYIDALIKEKQFETAKQIIQQAKTHGVAEEKLNVLETQLTPAVQVKANNPSQQQISNLVEHYQNGRFAEAEKLAVSITQEFPTHQFGWKVLGAVLAQTGRKSEAVDANQKAIALSPQDTESHNNLGITLKELGRLDEAEASYKQAIALKPDYAEAHNNLGAILQELGRLDEAEASYTQAIAFKPDYAEAHSNLGITLQERGRLNEAEASFRQAIALKPDYAEAHNNLGNTLKELGRLDEAEDSYTQAIALKPDYAEAHNNLGNTLKELGRLDEAEVSFRQAIALKPDFAEAHYNLGITLQELGRLDESEVSCTQAIALKPDFVDAHYNLGVTLKELGRLNEAVASYNQAIALKPDYAEVYSNLGDTLQELGRLDEAEVSFRQAIVFKPDYAEAHYSLGNTLQELGRLDEAEASYTQAIALKSDYAPAHYSLGNTLQELGRLDEAEASYTQAIALKSDYAGAHNNLGNTLKELGRLDEAEASYTKAIALKSDYAGAHYNLGITLQELGRLDEAEASYTQAIAFKPDYAKAHSNLGITFQELGRLDEAEASYKQAIAFKPDFAEAYSNLGNTLQERGRLDEALASCAQSIALKPDFAEAYVNFGITIKNVRFKSSNRKLYSPLTQLLTTRNFTRPNDIVGSILSLLKHDPLIKDLLLEKNFATSLKEATSIIGSLDKLTLLHDLMRLCPLPELQFEGLFVAMRSFLLKNLDKIEASPEFIYFLSTLSLHCFTNEYVYFESDEEILLIKELEDKITQTVMQSEQPKAINILCLASYRPLHQYDWCQQLEALDHLEEVKSRLIEEPLAEKVIAQDIPMLGEISDNVSRKVREQYEENPYPRWVKLAISIKAKPITAVCDELKLHLHSENIKSVTAPSILIAGCGTGQHSIETALRFSNCHVTAVDLSLASLAYAQRMTNDLGLRNLKYLQADILKLDQLEQEFDIIESSGVLHHMDEPMAGWRVLTDLLKPGGLMKIGLYSELARSQIVKARREIASLGIGTSEDDMRKFRRSLAESRDENHQLLTKSGDFFSLSMLRDLIFHVQEHRFTLPQIKNYLNELGLKFCGFPNQDIVSRFKELHGDEVDICDLVLWHEFEESNPRTFGGMYQFWCQKL